MNIKSMRVFRHPAFVLLSVTLLLFSHFLKADILTEQKLSQGIKSTMDEIVVMLKQNKAEYSQDSGLFYHDLNAELSKIIDFKRIALKVMGKHGRQASSEERQQFIKVFKRSLYKSYAAILLENDDIEVNVINASINNRNPKKAKVNLKVKAANGTTYDVLYSLNRGKDQVYRIENIIIMGINMGLAFKEHFHQQMKIYRGSIKSVIDNWSSKGIS